MVFIDTVNKNGTILYSITVLQYDIVLSCGVPTFPVAGVAHLDFDSMTPVQTLPADDGAGVAGQVY